LKIRNEIVTYGVHEPNLFMSHSSLIFRTCRIFSSNQHWISEHTRSSQKSVVLGNGQTKVRPARICNYTSSYNIIDNILPNSTFSIISYCSILLHCVALAFYYPFTTYVHLLLLFTLILLIANVHCTRGSVLVKALCYKPEGRGFDFR
jgi:hypothetical protein